MSATHGRVSVLSLNGLDNVGKTSQLRWLSRALAGATLTGAIDRWDSRWQVVAQTDFAKWWFEESSTGEHVGLVLDSYLARLAGSGTITLEDRGLPMLTAACAATAAVKDRISTESALALVDQMIKVRGLPKQAGIHVLLRHSTEPTEDARLALAREPRPISGWYAEYQNHLAEIVSVQEQRGDYHVTIVRGDRPILAVQSELRTCLRDLGLDVRTLPTNVIRRLWVLGGMSEAGKSTVGELLRAEHAVTRLKIGYLLDLSATRHGVDDPYAQWDEEELAEELTEELLWFAARNPGNHRICLESAHRFRATHQLKLIWGDVCTIVYVQADDAVRLGRTGEYRSALLARDAEKAKRGAPRIEDVADSVIDNARSLTHLKFAVSRLAAADMPRRAVPARPRSTPAPVADWLAEFVHSVADGEVAAVLATGSLARPWWQPGWSDLDLLVIRERCPLDWIRSRIGGLAFPPGLKVGVTMLTTAETNYEFLPPRVLHALRLAAHDGEGVFYARPDFSLPEPGEAGDDRASRQELPAVVLTLRRLLSRAPIDIRAVHKHIVLVLKIILRAEGRHVESAVGVVGEFAQVHPAVHVDLPSPAEIVTIPDSAAGDLEARVLAVAAAVLAYYDELVTGPTPAKPHSQIKEVADDLNK